MPRRRLDREERDLWAKVTRDVAPLPPRKVPPAPAESLNISSPPTAPVPCKGTQRIAAGPYMGSKTGASSGTSASLPAVTAAGDPRQARHIRRGRREIEATLDLHGMTQAEAFVALQQFIMAAKSRAQRTLLVITGKGARETIYAPVSRVSRGVLRHRFLEWVDGPLREHIASVSQAHQRHGGSGAFYVMLKKPVRR